MTPTRNIHLSDFIFEIIQIPQLFLHDLQAKYLSNHAKHPKKLVPYYVPSLFTILKSSYPTNQPARLEDDFSSRKKSSLQSFYQSFLSQVRPGPRLGPKDPLRLNKTPVKLPKAPAKLPQTSFPKAKMEVI